jgi:hypothetical protein
MTASRYLRSAALQTGNKKPLPRQSEWKRFLLRRNVDAIQCDQAKRRVEALIA